MPSTLSHGPISSVGKLNMDIAMPAQPKSATVHPIIPCSNIRGQPACYTVP